MISELSLIKAFRIVNKCFDWGGCWHNTGSSRANTIVGPFEESESTSSCSKANKYDRWNPFPNLDNSLLNSPTPTIIFIIASEIFKAFSVSLSHSNFKLKSGSDHSDKQDDNDPDIPVNIIWFSFII